MVTTWPDLATCDEAARKMEEGMDGQDMPEMPFDGQRMIWGGFGTIFDSDVDGDAAENGAETGTGTASRT